MKKVMCFGTFDLLHLGHLHYFQQAKQHGDYLIVVIARDKTKEKQQKEIIFSELERLELIRNLKVVDEVVLGNIDDHFKVIEEKKPAVVCLGYDQQIDEKMLQMTLRNRGLNPQIIRLKPYKAQEHKSSKIKDRILAF